MIDTVCHFQCFKLNVDLKSECLVNSDMGCFKLNVDLKSKCLVIWVTKATDDDSNEDDK